MVTKYMCALCGAMDNQQAFGGQGVDARHEPGCVATHLSKCAFSTEIDARLVSNGLQRMFRGHREPKLHDATDDQPSRAPMSERHFQQMEMNHKAFDFNARMSAMQIALNMSVQQPGMALADVVRYADTLYQFTINGVVPPPTPTNGTVLAMVPGKSPSDAKH